MITYFSIKAGKNLSSRSDTVCVFNWTLFTEIKQSEMENIAGSVEQKFFILYKFFFKIFGTKSTGILPLALIKNFSL